MKALIIKQESPFIFKKVFYKEKDGECLIYSNDKWNTVTPIGNDEMILFGKKYFIIKFEHDFELKRDYYFRKALEQDKTW